MKRILLILLALVCVMGITAAAADIAVTGASATSWITGKDPNAYIPQRMIDGDETTAFQFSTLTTPLGSEYVYFWFASSSDVAALWIKNGFWKITDGLDQYTRNSRVRSMVVDYLYADAYDYKDAQTVYLSDDSSRKNWTVIALGTHKNVTAVRFRIMDVYRGTRYPNDVCISEVRFVSDASQTLPPYSGGGSLYGLATQKLATRSGPGTEYTEKGTYNVSGQYIRVLSRAWDKRNGIWWVKCEIPYKGETRVLWTGYKRFDNSTLPLESIPVDSAYGGNPSGGNIAPVTIPPTTAPDTWKTVYRNFITSGRYQLYQYNPNAEYNTMLQQRSTAWDSFALHDIDGDGSPELIARADYGIEQADVYACRGGQAVWIGRMGGDNFFQDVVYYKQYRELFAFTGGPAMEVNAYGIENGMLYRRSIATTQVNSSGDTTTGMVMYVSDSILYQLLFNTLVAGQGVERSLSWHTMYSLNTDADWNAFLNSATY